MMCEQSKSNGHRIVSFAAQNRHEDEIAARLRHLVTLPADHAGVHVVLGIWVLLANHLSLGGAHLMMREGQIASATLYVDSHAQVIQRDGSALNMPTRSAMPESGIPGRLLRSSRLPQQAIQRVALARSIRVTATLGENADHLWLFEMRDGAESRVTSDREVEILIYGVDDPTLLK